MTPSLSSDIRCNMCSTSLVSLESAFNHLTSSYHRTEKLKLVKELKRNWNTDNLPQEIPSLHNKWNGGL
jgi:hypothetical protein